jgi:putative tricarboxylic transport membrane protein
MDWLAPALTNVLAPINLLLCFLGVAGGILVGALPGLTGTMAIALLVPFTYGLPPDSALIVLGGVYVGAMYGGSIAAILINTPGVPASIATTFDGYPMAVKGQGEEALAASATGSGIGGLLGTIVLLFFAPLLAAVSLQFGPPEYFWLGILGLTIIAGLSAGSLPKGLFGGLFGVLISTIGLSPSTGVARLTFHSSDLLGGVEIIIALIALFCIPQVLEMTETGGLAKSLALFTPRKGVSARTALFVARRWGNLIRSSIIGVIVGIIPGAGGNVAALLSYQEAMRAAKHPEEFGHGAIDGVIASETANNAEVEGSLIPLLTLGIPGAPQAAVLFGALLLQGMRPGPELFTGHGAEITYTFIFSLFLANLIMFVLGFFGSRIYARALNLPNYLLMPVVLALSVVGSFASRNNSFDLALMLGLGVLAYFGKKAKVPPAPIALGVILGPIIEQGLVESMMLSQATGSLAELFFTRPISIILILLTVLSSGWPLLQHWRAGRREASQGRAHTPPRRQKKVAGALSHRSANFILAAFGAVVCTAAMLALRGIDLQSAVLPGACAVTLGAISLGLLIKALRMPRPSAPPPEYRPWNVRAVLSTIGVAVAYLVFMQILGFYTSTFSAVAVQAFIMGGGRSRRWWIIPLASASVCAAFYLVFDLLFNVPFPQGYGL